jgi:hypothetical protein
MQVENSETELRVLCYGGGWPTNIGNAFIDLGVMAIIRAALPEARIGFASEMPRFFMGQSEQKGGWKRWFNRAGPGSMDRALDIASVTACDVLVLAGMMMDETGIREIGPSLVRIAERGVKILMLGSGAALYTEQEKEVFGEFLKKINPMGFISRDDRSYEMFAGSVGNSHRGIDCGFFVSDSYKPFTLDIPDYVAVTFDGGPEPEIKANGRQIVRAHHQCTGELPAGFLEKDRTLISDIPQDYLTLYANAQEIHSDRVHACVAGLTYGRSARLYHPTPRGSLFETVGGVGIRDRLIQLDLDKLREKKKKQIDLVRQIITDQARKIL